MSEPKTIDTLVKDIYLLFEEDHEFSDENVEQFGVQLADIIRSRIPRGVHKPALRMSQIGSPCLRQLWYKINKPDWAQPLPVPARIKFLYGDILEALLLFLAREAGHSVQGEQDEVVINGVLGHRDAIIDGVLVDVKSASTYGFQKFEKHLLESDDPFGYLDQINAYLFASKEDPLLVDKRTIAFLAIDKTLGHVVLDKYDENGVDYKEKVEFVRSVVEAPEPPERAFEDVPEGKSGNRKIGTKCSYCDFKERCWENLRMFNYAKGPIWFTHIEKEPRVVEDF